MAEQEDLLPFRWGSRQRKRPSGAIQAVSGLGQTVNFPLPKVGLLNYLVLKIRASVTLGAAAAFATDGPWSIVKRIRVDLNLSNMNLVDIDGRMAYDLARQMFRGFAFDGGGNYTPNGLTFAAGLTAGANPWVIPYLIPISANPGSDFDTGLINLQAPEVACNVEIRLADAGTDFAAPFTSIAGITAELNQCYFSSLDPRFVLLPIGQIVRTVQDTKAVVAVGENEITVQRQGKLMNTISRFIANGARSDGLDRIEVVGNINDTMYQEAAGFNSDEYERDYSMPRPVGIFTKDYWHARESPGSGDGRDLINLEVLTTFQNKLFVSAATVLGAGNNFHHLGRRVLVNFVSPATVGVSPLSQ
jgi:hypothetical protein